MKPKEKAESVSRLSGDLGGRQVLVASSRGQRPGGGGPAVCPFCPGAESLTPPTLWQEPEGKNWRTRVFENRFPILSGDPGSDAYGVHEVIVETPRHDAQIADLSIREISMVMRAIRERMRFHKDNPALKALFAFRNQGARGGASLPHPHSQLAGLSWVPQRLDSEVQAFMESADRGTCPLCLAATEPLIVLEEGSMRAFSPRAPRFPGETWIAPAHHEPSFMHFKDAWLDDLASLLKKTLSALSTVYATPGSPDEREATSKGFSCNLVLHTEPLDDESGTFHTHLEILPRREALAGFEIGSGVMVNFVNAEDSVNALREALPAADLTGGG